MSRIERAIEIATRKRSATTDGQLAGDALPVQPQNPADTTPFTDHHDTDETLQAPSHRPCSAERPRQQMPLPVNANPCLVMANAVESPAAEQYRKLKSSIVKSVRLGSCGNTLMITSSVPGEGKSLTALNLAISLAQDFDHTVLLIEADLRKPTLLKYLGLESSLGLSDCVLDGVDVDLALVETGIDGLSLLPAGRPVSNPVELFSSNRMKALMAEIKARDPNRFIIFDTTPLLPFAEPQYIANVVDGVVLVVREHLTSIDKLKRALEILNNHKLIGVVSNGVSRADSLHGYYGYYGNCY
jgi:exopolysaccharide/PEP-CTERM locus tyrosine autokinase